MASLDIYFPFKPGNYIQQETPTPMTPPATEPQPQPQPQPQTQQQPQVFRVSYDVESTKDAGYGYTQHYLKYNGERVPYKGITRNGAFVAIVSRRYYLLPHERVDEALKGQGLHCETYQDKWRQYWFAKTQPQDTAGAFVTNSVDGSESLKIYFCIIEDNVKIIYRRATTAVQAIKARHVGDLTEFIEKLGETTTQIAQQAHNYQPFLDQLKDHKLTDDVRKYFDDADLPQYVHDAVKHLHPDTTIHAAYVAAAAKIWEAESGVKTKLEHFTQLNNTIMMIAYILKLNPTP